MEEFMRKHGKRIVISISALVLVIAILAFTSLAIKHQNDVKHQNQITAEAKKKSSIKVKKEKQEKQKKQEDRAISEAVKDPDASSIATSTSKQTIQKNNFSNIFIKQLTSEKLPVKVQTILIKDQTATIILQDNIKQKDIKTYLDNYAKTVAIALQVADQNSDNEITTIKIARQISLKNGSQFGIATLWDGDQLKNNSNLKVEDTTADNLIPNASRYEFSGSIWSNFDQKQKNVYTNHITSGKAEDNNEFNTWFDNSTHKQD